jgi:hypothetical protein
VAEQDAFAVRVGGVDGGKLARLENVACGSGGGDVGGGEEAGAEFAASSETVFKLLAVSAVIESCIGCEAVFWGTA